MAWLVPETSLTGSKGPGQAVGALARFLFFARAPAVQLQQSDATGDHHWPFTPEANRRGRVEARRVLEALEASGATDVALILEVIHPFEADDDQVIDDLRKSVDYWRSALSGGGNTVAHP